MQRVAPRDPWRLGFVDLIRTDNGRVWRGRRIGDEGFEEFAGIAHGDWIRRHRLRRLQILFGRQSRPGVEQLAVHDRALQHHRAGADIVEAPVIVEGERARGDQHELKAARRQMKMEIGRAGVGQIDRQVGRDLVQQGRFRCWRGSPRWRDCRGLAAGTSPRTSHSGRDRSPRNPER